MRILIADQRSAARSALSLLLRERLEEVDIVGEAADSEELLAQLAVLHPDLVLLDWSLLDRSTTDLIETLRMHDGQPKLVILGTETELREAMTSGADAFVSKGDPPRRLLTTVRSLAMEDTDAQ